MKCRRTFATKLRSNAVINEESMPFKGFNTPDSPNQYHFTRKTLYKVESYQILDVEAWHETNRGVSENTFPHKIRNPT